VLGWRWRSKISDVLFTDWLVGLPHRTWAHTTHRGSCWFLGWKDTVVYFEDLNFFLWSQPLKYCTEYPW
jgi:hypothetical protein